MAYSLDLRDRVINSVESGMKKKNASITFNVSIKTIQNWLQLKKETGSICPRPYTGGARPKISQEVFESYINENPSQTLKEIGKHFNLTYGWAAYNLHKYGYVNKKKA
ncbi:MAG: IS630 transposase-related protein [Mariprofundaceae bacterium]|nr:IS630 transposase-related protein [Mariprofundaceae bacterium]